LINIICVLSEFSYPGLMLALLQYIVFSTG